MHVNVMQRVRERFLFVVLSGLCGIVTPVHAVTYTWNCTYNSYWDIPGCWGPLGLPTSSDYVVISTPYQVTIDSVTGDAYASRLYVGGSGSINQTAGTLTDALEYIGYNGNGTYTQSGGTHTVTNTLYIGYTGTDTGTYTQMGGTLNANQVNIGTADSKGIASVTNSTWIVTNGVNVGSTSLTGDGGSLGVGSGGTVSIGGNLTVYRPVANNAKVGEVATTGGGVIKVSGAMTLQGGKAYSGWGAVDSAGAVFASDMLTANGVTVGGAGSLWSTGTLIAGRNGTGTLTINADGTVTAGTGYMGEFAGSTGNIVVGGSNSLLQVGAGGLYVGGNSSRSGGAGILTVNSGGTVKAGSLTVWNGGSSISTGSTTSSTGGIIDIAGALTLYGGTATGYTGYVDGSFSSFPGSSSGIYAGSASLSNAGWVADLHYTGFTGAGTTTIASGATLANNRTYVGYNAGSNGTLNINAGGLVDTTGSAYLGNFGPTTTGPILPAATGTATVDGFGTIWAVNANQYIGVYGNGALNINASGIVQIGAGGYLGYYSGATGTVTVGGGGSAGYSRWELAGGLYVGGNNSASGGTGTLAVNSGGIVTAGSLTVWNGSVSPSSTASATGGLIKIAGALTLQGGTTTSYFGWVDSTHIVFDDSEGVISAGSASLSGAGTHWDTYAHYTGLTGTGATTIGSGATLASTTNTYLGYFSGSSGMLNINAGGLVDTGGDAYLGYLGATSATPSTPANPAASGTATVGGTGALWDVAGFLSVGEGGAGTLTVNSGGTVSSGGDTFIGRDSGSSGTLNVTAGGLVDTNNNNGFLGFSSGATGTATVGGTGAEWVMAGLSVGEGGAGTLTVNSGGRVISFGDSFIGRYSGSSGTLNVTAGGTVETPFNNGFLGFSSGATGTATVGGTGARWNMAGLYVGGTTAGSGGAGTLTVTTGGTVSAGVFKLWDTGVLNLNGGRLVVGSLDNFGAFNFNAGTVDVTNDLSLNGFGAPGSLALGKFDALAVGGTTTLNDYSTLDVNGGSFSTGWLVDNGGFAFNSGTFNLTSADLVIGATGLFGSNVGFDASRTVNVTNTVIIDSGAILGLNNAVFTAGTYANNGTVDLSGSVTSAGGGTFTNNNLLTGNGIITASLANSTTGQVRATLGDTLTFNGAANTNDGTLNLLGGTAVFDQGLTNSATGYVTGHGALITHTLLTNNGQMAFTDTTDVQGDIDNASGGSIVVAGQTTTFYDDVIHNGAEFRVMNGAQAVFFGSYSGAGNFTGTGELVFAGDLFPGNSPALVDVQGDMSLWGSSSVLFEIGGLTRGSEYDAFDIGGTLDLAGTLDVSWFDLGGGLFNASLGDSFDLFAADTITGSFNLLNLAMLDPGLKWQLDYILDPNSTDYVRLSVAAVPLPAAAWLFGSGFVVLFGFAKRRAAGA